MAEDIFYDENQKKQVNKLVDDMTLFDDDLMSHVFDKNIEATELVLRIILGQDIKVISVDGQDELKNPIVGGRDITLDVHAIDSHGKEIDIEVQGNSQGAAVERARFHSSMVDARMLKAGEDFKKLKDSYVIFIYKNDKFKEGQPLYHIDRIVRETGKPFEDGSHIIYVNGSYNGDDEIAQLMADFHQKDSEDIHFKALAEGVKHYKETEEGRETMCESVEKYGKECAKRQEISTKLTFIKKLMKEAGFTLEQALNMSDVTKDQRDYVISQLQK
jgi:hypothetical protein